MCVCAPRHAWMQEGVCVPKFRIQGRMILVNTVLNPKPLAPKLQKLYNRKDSITRGRRTTNSKHCRRRHPNYNRVEMKFRREN